MSELTPDDPNRLPPARRRRARRLLAPLDVDDRAAFLDRLAHLASPTFDFFLFSLLSGVVIGAGLLVDKPAIILLGALIAPLMAPVIGISLGTVIGSGRLFARSSIGFGIGSLLVFAMGLVAGAATQLWPTVDLQQAHFYAQLNWSNFILLSLGTVVAFVAFSHAGGSSGYAGAARVASVGLAYGLYVPLIVAGIGLSSGVAHLWPDGLVVYAVHLAWICLLGVMTLAALGFRPLTLFGYTMSGVVVLLVVILVIGIGGAGAVWGAQIALPTPIPPTPTHTPTATTTLTLTPTPVPPTATYTPTTPPTRTPTLPPTETPSPTPMYALISARTGEGAYIRKTPNGEVIRPYFNNTLVQMLPDRVELNGRTWVHVIVVSDGTEGWIMLSLLTVATPPPNW